ncbi:probable long-chain-alcohol O-fatty-acyltransferase 5 [Durio zibethinus]|uniref:Probable long-chain-alcohol O-fatty-acyltransferase 5 n=1 Tax=Durio zibethinus TaxID=66656 RepID=A0A6P5WPG1_DURZI|nr:probable long-chain-alcohol O-fatty-acyltransferase 5 [Durio zibethinus]
MGVELENFIKVWSLAIISFSYCFYISAKLPKGLFRLISLLPIFFLLIILPLNLSSFHLCGPTAFFLAWLANFKLLLFCFDQGPLSPLPPNVFHFISMASLPIKTKQNHQNIKKNENPCQNEAIPSEKSPGFAKTRQSMSHVPKPFLLAVKASLLAIFFHSYNYKQHLNKNVILAMYCLHTYLELEIVLALAALPTRAIFGFEIEPQFNDPYLATSLQDFWGHRWNLMVPSILRPTVYHPIRRMSTRIVGANWVSLPAVIAVFVVSGLMHELIYYYLTRAYPTWEVTWFFILQGVALAVEVAVKKVVPEKWRLHRAVSGPLALGFVAVTGVWLFFPQLLRSRADEKVIGEYNMLVDFVKDVLSL